MQVSILSARNPEGPLPDSYRFAYAEALVLAIVIHLSITLFHELGHASVGVVSGLKLRAFGVGMLLFERQELHWKAWKVRIRRPFRHGGAVALDLPLEMSDRLAITRYKLTVQAGAIADYSAIAVFALIAFVAPLPTFYHRAGIFIVLGMALQSQWSYSNPSPNTEPIGDTAILRRLQHDPQGVIREKKLKTGLQEIIGRVERGERFADWPDYVVEQFAQFDEKVIRETAGSEPDAYHFFRWIEYWCHIDRGAIDKAKTAGDALVTYSAERLGNEVTVEVLYVLAAVHHLTTNRYDTAYARQLVETLKADEVLEGADVIVIAQSIAMAESLVLLGEGARDEALARARKVLGDWTSKRGLPSVDMAERTELERIFKEVARPSALTA
jgi:hypothetical protein